MAPQSGFAEVVTDQPTVTPARMNGAPAVQFRMADTLQSPCFWIIVGALATLAAMYLLKPKG